MEKKRKVKVVPLIGCAVIIALVFIAPYISELTRNTSKSGTDVTVTIEQGSSTERIAEVLKENKLIKSEMIFRLRAKMSGKAAEMNYGTFNLNTGMCIPDIIDTLANTAYRKGTVMFTVPEGYSLEQTAKRAAETFSFSEDDFYNALSDDYDYEFIKSIPEKEGVKYRLQGFLFPNTYEFFADATAHDVIDTLLSQFEREIGEIKGYGNLSFYDVITLASLVEREAKLDEERPLIASVIYNRLNDGMKLQIDASVAYALTNGEYDKESLLYSDLETDSPYNTYKVAGLPAGPICSPGLSSINAAYAPAESEYLFYHTDTEKNDGSHIFTKTYEEHRDTMN